MERCLVVPEELIKKLNSAYFDSKLNIWDEINVDTVDDMIHCIINRLNKKNPKLSITSFKVESKDIIKNKIKNTGSSSNFAGYLEKKDGFIDALFFYIEPNVDSADDFLARYVMPTILGIYKGIDKKTKDLHINNMPVYIVSLCSTSRIRNNSVKKVIICAETMGFKYIDIFNNSYYEVLNKTGADEKAITQIKTLKEFDELLSVDGKNNYFEIDNKSKKIVILSNSLEANLSNVTAEVYRYILRIIPAVYLASNESFTIDASSLASFSNNRVSLIRDYIAKF